jgi:hypothetical protein
MSAKDQSHTIVSSDWANSRISQPRRAAGELDGGERRRRSTSGGGTSWVSGSVVDTCLKYPSLESS